MTRKLASIRKITNITPIDKADTIELVHIDGWHVVCKKDEHKVGGLCIYIEIDSFVPHAVAPFLTGSKVKKYNNVEGNRVKTRKILNTISQGLILPLKEYPGLLQEEHSDLTDTLGIQLWEKPIPAQLQGQMKGDFPKFIPKTDQERIQNISEEDYKFLRTAFRFEVTEKLDGSSMTVYKHEGIVGVCSRNIDLKIEDNNAFCNMYRKMPILDDILEGFAIQGELIGPGIQGNQYGLSESEFYVYDVYNIMTQKYLLPEKVLEFCMNTGLRHVPVLGTISLPESSAVLLETACGVSKLNHSKREGIVLKSTTNGISFKAVSQQWLTENE
jgi:RNA ligase (TIGR02306 family)